MALYMNNQIIHKGGGGRLPADFYCMGVANISVGKTSLFAACPSIIQDFYNYPFWRW